MGHGAEPFRAGQTAYADVGELYRASFARMAEADPPLGRVAWQVWAAVMVATVGRSKMLDRTSLNSLANAAGIKRKGSRTETGRRAEARATSAALRAIARTGAITYEPAKGGRPVESGFRPIVVGLPDPSLIGVKLTPIPKGKWGSEGDGNGGLNRRKIGVSQTSPTEERTPRRNSEGRRSAGGPSSAALMAARDGEAGTFTEDDL